MILLSAALATLSGKNPLKLTSDISLIYRVSLDKMRIFLITYVSPKSINGLGSVYSSFLDCLTMSVKGTVVSYLLDMKFRIPLGTAWILLILLPLRIMSWIVLIIVNAAPTAVSYYKLQFFSLEVLIIG